MQKWPAFLHVKEIMQIDERKRPLQQHIWNSGTTEEEMEAYRMKRQRPDDPMASFLDSTNSSLTWPKIDSADTFF